MAVAAKKKTVRKKAAKKKKAAGTSAKKIKKGERFSCSVCGVAVRIDEVCGCVDTCDIICCGKEMKPNKK